jgi:hypothetical protein
MTATTHGKKAVMPTVMAITDERLAHALAGYAGMVDRVISDPKRWLGMDEDPPPQSRFPTRALDSLRNRAFAKTTPASSLWPRLPVDKRVQWWVTRIGISADLAVAAPRLAGALADRVMLQAALGAAAAGLAVCTTASEHGRIAGQGWVPLLGTVLFDRDLSSTDLAVPPPAESDRRLATVPPDADPPRAGHDIRSDGARRAATTLWQLARTFTDLHPLLDQRTRGSSLARSMARLPVVGIAGGWLDERGGIGKAANATAQLIDSSQAA